MVFDKKQGYFFISYQPLLSIYCMGYILTRRKMKKTYCQLLLIFVFCSIFQLLQPMESKVVLKIIPDDLGFIMTDAIQRGRETGAQEQKEHDTKIIEMLKAEYQQKCDAYEEQMSAATKFRQTQQNMIRLTNIELGNAETRYAQLSGEIKRKIEELNGIVEEMEESHPCAKPPIPQLRRLIEDLKQVASK